MSRWHAEGFGKEGDECVVGGPVDGRGCKPNEQPTVPDPTDLRDAGARNHANQERCASRSIADHLLPLAGPWLVGAQG